MNLQKRCKAIHGKYSIQKVTTEDGKIITDEHCDPENE